MLETLFNLVEHFLTGVGPFLLLISVLIFIHELGHFTAAVLCGVHVETFSIGFGPKIFKYVKKSADPKLNTTYCLSIIPLGGFVKMLGSDPAEEVAPEYKKYAFLKKNYFQKVSIALAGPFMNAIFAVFAFWALAYSGMVVQKPVVGDVQSESALAKAGVQSGDLIVSIDDKKIQSWREVERYTEDKIGKNVNLGLVRTLHSEDRSVTEAYQVNLDVVSKKNFGFNTLRKEVGSLELSKLSRGALVATDSNSFARKNGLPAMLQITKVDDKPVLYFRDLEKQIAAAAKSGSLKIEYEAIALEGSTENETSAEKSNEKEVQKKPQLLTAVIRVKSLRGRSKPWLEKLGFENPEVYVSGVSEGGAAEEAGILRGDKILALNGAPVRSWKDFSLVQEIKASNNEVIVKWQQPSGKIIIKPVKPKMSEVMGDGVIEKKWLLGIQNFSFHQPAQQTKAYYNSSLWSAVAFGVNQTIFWSKSIAITFIKLLTYQISPKNISGVITIGSISAQAYERGFSVFLKIMAIISVNLFILNLIPIPVLDGGHVLVFTIEAIYRKPLNAKLMMFAQSIGIIFLLGVLALSLFNDIVRMFF